MAALTPRSAAIITKPVPLSPSWVSPGDTVVAAPGTPLVWSPLSSSKSAHYQVELDTVSTFDSGNLIRKQTYVGDSGFEYYNGSAWVGFSTAGVPVTYSGNHVRFTPSVSGTWYRRVRQG